MLQIKKEERLEGERAVKVKLSLHPAWITSLVPSVPLNSPQLVGININKVEINTVLSV